MTAESATHNHVTKPLPLVRLVAAGFRVVLDKATARGSEAEGTTMAIAASARGGGSRFQHSCGLGFDPRAICPALGKVPDDPAGGSAEVDFYGAADDGASIVRKQQTESI